MKPLTGDAVRRWLSTAVALAAGVCAFYALFGYVAGASVHSGPPLEQVFGLAAASVLLVAAAAFARSRKPTVSDFSLASQQMAVGCGGLLVLSIGAAIIYSSFHY